MTLASAALMDPFMIPIVVVPTIFIGLPLAIGYARRLWKDAEGPRRSQLPDDSAQRLIQMQNSIDAMAVEIERISEGQRFVTKVLAARQGDALPAGDAAAKVSERSGQR
jgi:hypothetical protein